MNTLKSLTFVPAPVKAPNNPTVFRRERLLQRLQEQLQLVKDPSYAPLLTRWKKDEDGLKRTVEHHRRIKPWWRVDEKSFAKDLKAALKAWKAEAEANYRKSPYVVTSERGASTSSSAIVNKFASWYRALGFSGASSHSGCRTAITNWARKISTVGGSLRDVQLLARHSALSTTQRYIEADAGAMRRVVEQS